MPRRLLLALFITVSITASAQKTATDFGYRQLQMTFEKDTVNVLIASKKGEDEKPKPLFLFCQGSLPVPLIVYDDNGAAGIVPFSEEALTEKFHLVVIGKPGIPVTAHTSQLNPDFTFADEIGNFPEAYLRNNYLDYYVQRNTFVIKTLQKNNWVQKDILVAAGHSEGATVAAKLALDNKAVTHLIFSSGNPMGRILSMIERSSKFENDSTQMAESDFDYWNYLLTQNEQKDSVDYYAQTDYSFSIPPMEYLKKLKIPVLVSYGSVDYSTPFNDYFRVWCMQNQKSNVAFQCYIGLEHNFFGTHENGKPDYNQFNWNKVAQDWFAWLEKN
jgi:dienelactone hydrolase